MSEQALPTDRLLTKVETMIHEKEEGGLYTFVDGTRTLGRYQHVERLGHVDCDGLLAGEVYVQEKLDGANLTVAWDPNQGIIIASRNMAISVGGKVRKPFDGACDYVHAHAGITSLLNEHPTWVLRGEWLKRHSINYTAEAMRKFYVFDVQCEGRYLDPCEYAPVLAQHGVEYIPTLATLTNPTTEELAQHVQGPSMWGAPQKEGIVIKRSTFTNRWGRTVWAKMVSDDFKLKNKVEFGATRHDELEVQFATLANRHFVLKEIHKLEGELERRVEAKDIARVLETCWRVLIEEEMYGFITKAKRVNGGRVVDFVKMRGFVVAAVRETVLAYVNGLLGAVA
jgi:hypothetical protein